MPTTLSHFADVKSVTYAIGVGDPVPIGSCSDFRIEQTEGRVEGEDNGVISGAVSSHMVRRQLTWSLKTLDIKELNALRAVNDVVTWKFVWVASTTQAGTPLADQLVTLTRCIIDKIDASPETKGQGMYGIRGHCLATSNDASQLTMVAAS